MRMRRILAAIISLVGLICVSACTSRLSTEEASELIQALPVDTVYSTIMIIGRHHTYGTAQRAVDEFEAANAELIAEGILTSRQVYEERGQGFISSKWVSYTVSAELADSVRALVVQDRGDGSFMVRSGELAFVDIVGVFQEDKSLTAEIEYRVRFDPTILNVGRSAVEPGTIYTRKAIAKKFDTGWRVAK